MTKPSKPTKPSPGQPKQGLPFIAFGFIGFLSAITVLTFTLSSTGMLLNGPNSKDQISLRDVSNRRSHFFNHYWAGK